MKSLTKEKKELKEYSELVKESITNVYVFNKIKRMIEKQTAKEIFKFLLDPEHIAKYGKTERERHVINSYIRDVMRLKFNLKL